MESKKENSVIRAVVAFVLAFLLSLLLVGLTALVVTDTQVLSEAGFKKLVSDEYVDSVYQDIMSSAYDYTLPTNIDTDVLNDTYTVEEVERDVFGFIEAAFEGTEYFPALTESEGKLKEHVLKYFEDYYKELEEDWEDWDDDEELDEETEEIADKYVKEISEIYTTKVKMPGIEAILKVKTVFTSIFRIALPIVAVLALAFGLLIVFIYRPRWRGLRFLTCSLFATGIMCAAAPAMLYFGRIYERLSLAPEYFYRFVITFIGNTLETCIFAGAAWLILAALMLAVTVALRASSKRMEKEEF